MAAPFSFVDSKLERAIAAYLISVPGCGTVDDVLPYLSVGTNTYPNTTIIPVRGTALPKFTGNYRIQLWISIKGSATSPVNAANPQTPIVAFAQRVEKTWDALMQSDNDRNFALTARLITAAGRALATSADPQIAANNADMVDFSVMEWDDEGFAQGKADEEGCSWERILFFNAAACSANVD